MGVLASAQELLTAFIGLEMSSISSYVLAGYRREGVVEPLPFGVYCDVAVPGRVRVGDPVRLAVADAVQA